MCGGWDVSLRCQLPTEDLDALVSVTGDDDLANLLEEYDAASRDRLEPLKIRAFLFPTRTPAVVPPSLPPTSPRSTTTNKKTSPRESTTNVHHHHLHRKNSSPGTAARVSTTTSASSQWWAGPQPQASLIRSSARAATVAQARPHRYLVHNGSHWQ
ncbi:hypothetical protein PR202_gb12931 [Eleusine coracana subsp. coracana]|uniref:PB1 domain-containing protein n=1 Tax=Eleusine coracana subsp. coracana TaxID=191504 RepID=A0AAV5ESF4_ELECO|nr:hypothetical protein PR202_gb12931 [Eleusine coracana subsp. coracana]